VESDAYDIYDLDNGYIDIQWIMPIGRDCIYEHLGKDIHLKAPNFWFAVAAGKK
jgi:hypothetical protein